MYTTPIAFLLLFIVATQCTHFRGGRITWSTAKDSNTVSFTVTTYWNASFVPSQLTLYFGDGSRFSAQSFEMSEVPGYATLVFKTSHDYAEAGTYVASFEECCRIEQLNGNAGGATNRLEARVVVDGSYRQSPVVEVPPILTFKIGYNFFALQSSLPVSGWEFSNPSISGLPYDYTTGIFDAVNDPTITPSSNPYGANFEWTTDDSDVGLWAASIYVTTIHGSFTVDFLINVTAEYTIPNPPKITITPGKNYYGLTDGQTASFTVVCPHDDPSVQYQLVTPIAYEGFQMNGQSVAILDVAANDPVTITYTPKPDYSYADNIQYPVSLYCREKDNGYSTYTTVVVSVGKPLVLTPPPSTTVDCVSPCKCLNVTGVASYTDGCCGIAKVWYQDAFPDSSCNTQVTRTWYATNDCGQSATARQIIYVNDQTPPVITPTGFGDLTLQCPVLPTGTPAAKDTCSAVTINTTVVPALSNACKQTVVRTFTATDKCGNKAFSSQNINIQDTTPPRLFRTVESTFSYRRDCPFQSTAFDGIVRGTDNCAQAVNVTFVDNNRPACGKWTRVFTGSDVCGNKATLSIDLEISHANLPNITILPNYGNYECPADTAFSPVPTAKSFCGDSLPVTKVSENVVRDYRNCPVLAVRVWSATDACGNTATKTENITLRDVTPPTLCVPPNIAVECVYGAQCYNPCSDYYLPERTGGYAHGTDKCGDNVTITYNDVLIPGDCRYTSTSDKINRTWTATDVCGNSISKSQIITIVDTKAPEFCPPPNFVGQCPADVKRAPAPKDFSDCKPVKFNYTDEIVYATAPCQNRIVKRTWLVTDLCGNPATSIQIINITDTIRPNITVPCDTTVECKPKAYNLTATGVASGTDNCKMGKDATYVDVVVTLDKIVREWTVYDACGNTNKANQTIYLNNSIPDIVCPYDATVACTDSSYPNVTGYATANDLCSGTIIPTYSDSEFGTCPRVITRTWYAYNDVTKKTSSCQQTITIWHDEGPHLKVPADLTVQCVFQSTVNNTGSACSSQFCIDENITEPAHTDAWEGTQCKPDYALKRTWHTTDDCKRASVGVQTVYIHDTTPPSVVIPYECSVTCRLNVSTALCGNAFALDNCDADGNPVSISYKDSLVASKYSCPSTLLRVWTATDCSGNQAVAEQTININEGAPVFDPYLPKTLPPVQCVDCVTFNDIWATGACGEPIKAVPTITKDGICPTTVTITWTATDDCGRESTFVQTVLVEDTTPPELDVSDLKDIVVECDADIPTFGVVQASDNCPLVRKPTFTDRFVPGNCTCDSCTKILERTWVVQDRCGLYSKSYVQRIISVKTKNPVITLPNVPAIPCGSAYTADEDGTGYATAVDSCGSPLFVTYVDNRFVLDDGTIQITRKWSTSDSCNHVAEADQIIHITASTSDYGYVFKVPPTRNLPCRGNIHADELLFPEYNSYSDDYNSELYASSPCGNVTITNSMDATCDFASLGKYKRTWNAILNGKIFESKTQDIFVEDCRSYGSGIAGLPNAPVAVSKGLPASVSPSFTIYDLDIPCDTFTVTWNFGDGYPLTYQCSPKGSNPLCTFDEYKSALTVSASHNYTSAAVFKVTVTVSGQRSNGANDAHAEGIVVTADRYSGTVSGCTELDYSNDDVLPTPPLYGGYAPKYSCLKPWIILVPDGYTTKFVEAHCAGRPKLDFTASFLPVDGYKPTGSFVLSWPTCSGGLYFNGTVEHLSVFGDNSALLVGKATFNKAPGVGLNFSLYVLDNGKYGDSLHLRITTTAGIVVFDTDPCMPTVVDYKEQPTSEPVNYVHNVDDDDKSTVTVYTPSTEQVSALQSETPTTEPTTSAPTPSKSTGSSSSNVGMIVGIVVGIMVFIVVVAIIVFVLLKQQQTKTASTASSSFMSM